MHWQWILSTAGTHFWMTGNFMANAFRAMQMQHAFETVVSLVLDLKH